MLMQNIAYELSILLNGQNDSNQVIIISSLEFMCLRDTSKVRC